MSENKEELKKANSIFAEGDKMLNKVTTNSDYKSNVNERERKKKSNC